MEQLIQKVISGFELFTKGSQPSLLMKAPGRINLIGEHTDYNDGLVFPAAIDKCFVYAFKRNNSNIINVHALDLTETFKIDLDDLKKTESSWVNFLIGLVKQLFENGCVIEGFDCVMASDIPIGSGMSSSSALECGFIGGINELFILGLKPWQMITMSHTSNHGFLGVKGGILDQFSSFFGKEGQAMLLDCRDQTFEYKPISFENHRIVLINTKVTHDHVTGDYNKGPEECKQAVALIKDKFPDINSLRDVNIEMVDHCQLPLHLADRVDFIFNENKRVLAFANALEANNLNKIGELLYQSHEGLKNQYLVSCRELDLLVDLTKNIPQVLGSRMMGGGFGGCTINIIEASNATKVINEVMSKYELETGIKPEAYFVKISAGVGAVEWNGDFTKSHN